MQLVQGDNRTHKAYIIKRESFVYMSKQSDP